MSDLEFRVTELERMMANVFVIGTVVENDLDNAKSRVKIGDVETGWLSWRADRAGEDRSWDAFDKDEQVFVGSLNGDLTQGVILCSLYQKKYPAPANNVDVTRRVFGDGLVIEHNRARKLTKISALDSDGTLVLEAKNIIQRTGENGYLHTDNYGKAYRLTHTGGNTYMSETWNNITVVTSIPDHGYEASGIVATPEEEG